MNFLKNNIVAKKLAKKKKITIVQTDEEKDAKLKLIEVSKLYSHPLKIVKATGATGIKGGKRLLTAFILYFVSSSILFLFTIERIIVNEFSVINLFYLIAVIIVLVGSTVLVTYKSYRFLITDTIRVLHQELTVVFREVSDIVIDKVSILLKDKVDISKVNYAQVVNFPNIVNDHYKMLPKFLRKGIIKILNIIPISSMVMDAREDIMNNNRIAAGKKLYGQMDGYIVKSINTKNNSIWIWWLLPCKIAGVIMIVLFLIG
jgi:hypothetical protein